MDLAICSFNINSKAGQNGDALKQFLNNEFINLLTFVNLFLLQECVWSDIRSQVTVLNNDFSMHKSEEGSVNNVVLYRTDKFKIASGNWDSEIKRKLINQNMEIGRISYQLLSYYNNNETNYLLALSYHGQNVARNWLKNSTNDWAQKQLEDIFCMFETILTYKQEWENKNDNNSLKIIIGIDTNVKIDGENHLFKASFASWRKKRQRMGLTSLILLDKSQQIRSRELDFLIISEEKNFQPNQVYESRFISKDIVTDHYPVIAVFPAIQVQPNQSNHVDNNWLKETMHHIKSLSDKQLKQFLTEYKISGSGSRKQKKIVLIEDWLKYTVNLHENVRKELSGTKTSLRIPRNNQYSQTQQEILHYTYASTKQQLKAFLYVQGSRQVNLTKQALINLIKNSLPSQQDEQITMLRNLQKMLPASYRADSSRQSHQGLHEEIMEYIFSMTDQELRKFLTKHQIAGKGRQDLRKQDRIELIESWLFMQPILLKNVPTTVKKLFNERCPERCCPKIEE